MGRQNYRRANPAIAPAGSAAPHGDPYADYLKWVSQGRPSLGGSAAARSEPGTVLVSESVPLSQHVQVQELGALPELQNLHAPAKPPLWQRITEAFRRS